MLSTELDPGDPEGEKSCVGSLEGGIERAEQAQIRSEAVEVEGSRKELRGQSCICSQRRDWGSEGGTTLSTVTQMMTKGAGLWSGICKASDIIPIHLLETPLCWGATVPNVAL